MLANPNSPSSPSSDDIFFDDTLNQPICTGVLESVADNYSHITPWREKPNMYINREIMHQNQSSTNNPLFQISSNWSTPTSREPDKRIESDQNRTNLENDKNQSFNDELQQTNKKQQKYSPNFEEDTFYFLNEENEFELEEEISFSEEFDLNDELFYESESNEMNHNIENFSIDTKSQKDLVFGTTDTSIDLSEKVKDFQYYYYKVFTEKKKFGKEFVKKIHDDYMRFFLYFPKMERTQYRSIQTYFQDYLKYQNTIIPFLKNNKYQILHSIPGLLENLKNK